MPYTTGWWLDGAMGQQFIAHAEQLAAQYGVPALIAAHKGFALTSFDQSKAATRDVGVVAKLFPNMNFMIYHSGFDNSDLLAFPPGGLGTSTSGPYPLDVTARGSFSLGMGTDAAVQSTQRGVDNFIKALRENGWSARNFAPGGLPGVRGKTHPLDPINGDGDPGVHSNVPNVYAELGSVWSSVQSNPTAASYLLGKLIYYVGARQIVWGTDSLWYGSPQGLIETFRAFEMSNAIKELYNLPWGLHGDIDDPTRDTRIGSNYNGHPAPERSIRNGILGRNAARVYDIDADDSLGLIRCDDVQKIRDEYHAEPARRRDPSRAEDPARALRCAAPRSVVPRRDEGAEREREAAAGLGREAPKAVPCRGPPTLAFGSLRVGRLRRPPCSAFGDRRRPRAHAEGGFHQPCKSSASCVAARRRARPARRARAIRSPAREP